jgi:hypothetical protein
MDIIRNNKTRITILAGTAALLLVYAFFFLSAVILPTQITAKGEVTAIGSHVQYMEGREATLVSATYSERQQMMEIVMQLGNDSLDNIDTYYYALIADGNVRDAVKIEEVINERLLTVIRVSGLRKFHEAEFVFAPKLKPIEEISSVEEGFFILNRHNLKDGTVDVKKGKKAYLAERILSVIDALVQELDRASAGLSSLETKLAALQDSNNDLYENMAFMTSAEREQADRAIVSNQEEMVRVSEDIVSAKGDIALIESRIKDAKATEKEIMDT